MVGGGVTAAAAVLGNVFVGKEALSWFRGLRAPRFQLPMPGFRVGRRGLLRDHGRRLGRGIDRRDAGAIAWAVAVLAGNEAWNGLLFGRRSPRAAFVGVLVFLVPLGGLQRSVWPDKRSRWILLPYTTYVIAYDVPWAYRLWRLNASRGS